MEHLLPWLQLQLTPGLGRVGLMRLIQHFKSAENVIRNAERGWPDLPGLRRGLAQGLPAAADHKVQNACRRLKDVGGQLLTLWDPGDPDSLRQIEDPPVILYCRGELPKGPAVAIVGSRQPTDFGRRFTENIASQLADAGIVTVSGLARGIDSAAHRGCLNAGGVTIAVLGCGVDRVYPPENAKLHHQILAQGALLSEYPPGSEPLPGHFPGRNRIISALGLGTLVIEAARDSGSLITAEFALDQGREVMAVPGGVDRATSYGPNLLIKQGAHPVTEAEEILQIIGLPARPGTTRLCPEDPVKSLPAATLKVLAALGSSPRHSDELVTESGLTPMELSVILLHLELQGYAEKLPGGRYVRCDRAV
jgi:DNA processing protein